MHKQKAFTLVELLVVISIIALLLSILMPALSRTRQMVRQTICLTRIRTLGLAAMLYANNNDGELPMCGSRDKNGNLGAWSGMGNDYPTAPYWDARLISYLGVKNFNVRRPDLPSIGNAANVLLCPSVAVSQRNLVKQIEANSYGPLIYYPRSYRINALVTGHTTTLDGSYDIDNAYRRSSKISGIRRASQVLLFVDTRIHHEKSVFNSIYGWAARGWLDVYPSHFVKTKPFIGVNPWNLDAAYGNSGFGFVDGHSEKLKCQFTEYHNDSSYIDYPDPIAGIKFHPSGKW